MKNCAKRFPFERSCQELEKLGKCSYEQIPQCPVSNNNHLNSIDGLRGLAAIAVMIFHYEAIISLDPVSLRFPRASSQYTHLALLGVELFFMISGFVILMSAERAKSATSFLLGRVARIYPAYFVSVIPAALAMLAMYGPSRHLLIQVSANLTMLSRVVKIDYLITPYWTLTYELWFYVIMAVLVRLRLLPHIAVLCLFWLLVFLPLHALDRMGIIHLPGESFHLATLIGFGSFFIIGIASYLLFTGKHLPSVVMCLLLATFYNVFGRGDWAEVSGFDYLFATVAFEVILLLAVNFRVSVLLLGPLVWIGQLSYSLYLLHMSLGLLLWVACHRVGVSSVASVAVSVPLSIWLASLSRRWVEIPGQVLLKRIFHLNNAARTSAFLDLESAKLGS